MNIQLIKCGNESCKKKLYVNINDLASPPIVFCNKQCVNSFLDIEFSQKQNNYEDPAEINKLVQSVIGYTKQIQDELDKFKNIRSTYFDLFKGHNMKTKLKSETYTHKWSFDHDDDKENE